MAEHMSAQVSALSSRIAAGKADPISDEEREIVANLRAGFEKKYGSKGGAPRRTRTRPVIKYS